MSFYEPKSSKTQSVLSTGHPRLPISTSNPSIMVEQITLYTAKVCPWAHRAEITLEEAQLPYKRFEVNLRDKPEWYAPKVNPASKVPAVAYGGPDVQADQPSPDSQKIAESGVLIEFFADLSKDVPLLPKDPVQRAKARFFIETVTPKLFGAYYSAIRSGADPAGFVEAVEVLQQLLPPTGYAVGNWSIADAAVTPFLARAELAFTNDLGTFEAGKGKVVWARLEQEPQYERFRKYLADVKGRKSFQKTWDPEHLKDFYQKVFAKENSA
ncbi:hypothetical protein CPB83DRAFT_855876 [Crepidotus variabilis]|uniref:GST N-terminal domain-containing protein n=1 Tax=Crepidotus variabilis TaxID=179855 RepID=A0A9P6EF00_9AGAR|nr:hypothetical protein CPB83DRAFT_855876 [Crepidotus variabilis]